MNKKILLIFVLIIFLTASKSNDLELQKTAKNEAWTTEAELENIIDRFDSPNHYFIDLRPANKYREGYIKNFVNLDRDTTLKTYLDKTAKWSYIVVMAESIEAASEATSFLEGLGFYNLKSIQMENEQVLNYFQNLALIEIIEDNDVCPPGGC